MSRRVLTAVVLLAAATTACGSSARGDVSRSRTAGDPGGRALLGLFAVAPGSCHGPEVHGSWFRMVQSGGDVARGPFVTNGDSPCAVKTYTALNPGSGGGLVTGGYQPQPASPFDAAHNGAASSILKPAPFFAVKFAVSTNPTDPQTGSHAAPPAIELARGKLSGDLGAWGVAWNGQQFNQGAPKPDGKTNANTTAPSGTYDARTGKYTLQWTSQIAGGPFNGFTGIWHLEGTFKEKL